MGFSAISEIVVAFCRHAVLAGLVQFLKIDLAVPKNIPTPMLVLDHFRMFSQELIHELFELRNVSGVADSISLSLGKHTYTPRSPFNSVSRKGKKLLKCRNSKIRVL